MKGRGHGSAGREAVHIRLLGRLSVSLGDRVVGEGAWRLRKSASLVKLLALARGHRIHRERAMDFLWPDLGVQAAAHNLHQALYIAAGLLTLTPSMPPPT